jgi:high-affinity iron transporter
MLPTFVIGLREGLEASLIVGIVAAFLKQRGRADLLRWVFAGVAAAISLCVAVGVALEIVSRDLPQRQQEGLETVIGAVAVAMVTYMVVWMRRNSRNLKGQLEGAAGAALAAGSGTALVLMAFLAVLREGLETVGFLLAAFNESDNASAAGSGASLGIVVSVALGYLIYRGGVRLNLSKFFRVTGLVLVLVAGGLFVSAFHTAHEAGWLNAGQQSTFDLTWLVQPGSVQASLLTGMLGIQPRPVLIEVIAWLVYVVPVGVYVALPPGKGPSRASVLRGALAGAAVAAIGAIVLTTLAPGGARPRPVTAAAANPAAISAVISAQVLSVDGEHAVLRTNITGENQDLTLLRSGLQRHAGLDATAYAVTSTGAAKAPSTMTMDEVAAVNGGRLPLGVRVTSDSVTVTYPASTIVTTWVDTSTARVIDVLATTRVTTIAALSIGPTAIGSPTSSTTQLPRSAVASAVSAVRSDRAAADRRNTMRAIAVALASLAVVLLALAAGVVWGNRRRRRGRGRVAVITPQPKMVSS